MLLIATVSRVIKGSPNGMRPWDTVARLLHFCLQRQSLILLDDLPGCYEEEEGSKQFGLRIPILILCHTFTRKWRVLSLVRLVVGGWWGHLALSHHGSPFHHSIGREYESLAACYYLSIGIVLRYVRSTLFLYSPTLRSTGIPLQLNTDSFIINFKKFPASTLYPCSPRLSTYLTVPIPVGVSYGALTWPFAKITVRRSQQGRCIWRTVLGAKFARNLYILWFPGPKHELAWFFGLPLTSTRQS